MRRPIHAAIALVIAAFLLSGCNDLGEWTNIPRPTWWPFGQPVESTAGPATPAAPPLTLLTWSISADEAAFLQSRIDEFAALHPGPPIRLEISTDYQQRLIDPDPFDPRADVFLVTGFNLPRLIAANLLGPLPGELNQLDAVAPTLRSGFGVGSAAFCIPRDVHTLALAYNPALFDRVNLPYPHSGWDWNDLALAAEAVTDQDFFLFAMTINPDLSRIAPFMLQAGGEWIDPATGQPVLDSEPVRAGMQFFVELFQSGNAVYDTTLDSIWPGEAFGRGSAGMTIEGSWLLPFLAAQFPRFPYETAELPAGPQGRATVAFTTCIGVNPNSSQRARTNALAAYLARPDVAAEWREFHGGMPVFAEELASWQAVDPRRTPFAAGVAYARVWQFPLNQDHLPEMATPIIRAVIAGDQTVENLAQRLQSAAQNTTPTQP